MAATARRSGVAPEMPSETGGSHGTGQTACMNQ